LQRSDGQVIDSQALAGKPTVLVFYLGFGCLHCVEQLKKLEPKREEFQSSGLQMIAVSTESQELLLKGMSTYDQPLSIPLLADPTHRVFRDFGCYDDFEQTPLHGTFVIDAQGRVVWQDISHEPFMDIDFLLKEAVRQLKLTRP
jgi:peroxiredoxin